LAISSAPALTSTWRAVGPDDDPGLEVAPSRSDLCRPTVRLYLFDLHPFDHRRTRILRLLDEHMVEFAACHHVDEWSPVSLNALAAQPVGHPGSVGRPLSDRTYIEIEQASSPAGDPTGTGLVPGQLLLLQYEH
jgi:hypothetical protein